MERLLFALSLDDSKKRQLLANLFFPSSLRIPFSSFFHQIARLEFILTAEKVKWLNLFLKMGNFLMFQACLGKPGSISEILTFFILKISSHSPFKRAVCVMGGEISYSCIFHCYNRDVKAIPFLSLQSFLYPLELKFFWKKYYYAIYRCQWAAVICNTFILITCIILKTCLFVLLPVKYLLCIYCFNNCIPFIFLRLLFQTNSQLVQIHLGWAVNNMLGSSP